MNSNDVPIRYARGHGYSDISCLVGLTMKHHVFIYQLYVKNPSLPIDGYIAEIYHRFSHIVSHSFMTRTFKTIGSFKGTMRLTSRFPSGRNSAATFLYLKEYLGFVDVIHEHSRLVFADEKPMKEIMIYGKVRRDPFMGNTPFHEMNANSKIGITF